MASDRIPARLTVTWAFVAAGVAAASVVVPMRADALAPSPGELAVGWSLLTGSMLATRRLHVWFFLGLGGVLWVAVGIAPLGPDILEQPLERLALVPAALLVCASACVPANTDQRVVVVACAGAVGVAAVSGVEANRAALGLIGLAALVVPALSRSRRWGTAVVQVGLGAGLVAAGLSGNGASAIPANVSVSILVLTMTCCAVAVGWRTGSGVRIDAGLSLEGPTDLGEALGRALGTGYVAVALPSADGGWLESGGRPCEPGPTWSDVQDAEGRLLARTMPELVVEPGLVPDLQRFLRVVGQGARLRAALRDQAEQLERSRIRLVSASEDERLRLVSRIEGGPLRRLDQITQVLRARPDGPMWTERIAASRRTLDELVGGLDPVESGGGLVPALTRLTNAAGVPLVATGDPPRGLDPAAARALWFACAEALANVRKHAFGSPPSVSLDTTDGLALTVSDNGPGGADLSGAGLAGLADRLALVGGRLDLGASGVGTVLTAWVPAQDPSGAPLRTDDLPAPMTAQPELARLEP